VTDEPMVAFVCNRPAMHSTDRGWISDDSTNCIDDPVDVLNYCRKVCRQFNPLIGTLKPQSNGPLYSNTVIGTLAVDE